VVRGVGANAWTILISPVSDVAAVEAQSFHVGIGCACSRGVGISGGASVKSLIG
tara:strand:+ start:702 stop:863 length:162 start_codon:yes stop_codon:yes gene_type:complete